MGGSTHFHFGHLVPHVANKLKMKRQSASSDCSSGGFYTYPTGSTKLDSLQPVNITWNTECLSGTDNVDVYLLFPAAQENTRIHLWRDNPYSQGWLEVNLKPKWWNSTAEVQLQLNIVPAGTPPFLQTLPGAPFFTATYTEPEGGVPAEADTSITDTDGGITTAGSTSDNNSSSMSGGKIAAAVLVPLLFLGLLALAWLKIKRQRGKEKRKRWSEAVDKRMSTISTDWKSMSAAGANAAIRNSVAVDANGNRASSFSFGAIRPATTYDDSGRAGLGAARQSSYGSIGNTSGEMSQVRQSVFTVGDRQSRVSFALDARPRPSMSSYGDRSSSYTANRPSRAFHNAFVPPIPNVPTPTRHDSSDSDTAGAMSPTQTVGAAPLTAEAINARFSYYNYEGYEDDGQGDGHARTQTQRTPPSETQSGYFPSQEAQRQESGQGQEIEYPETLFNAAGLISPTTPAPQAPPQAYSPAPSHSMFSGFAPPAAEGSPDDMLKAYAARNAAAARGGGALSPPSGLRSPPPTASAHSSFVVGHPSVVPDAPPTTIPASNSRRLTFNAANPGVYSPARGAYGADAKWE